MRGKGRARGVAIIKSDDISGAGVVEMGFVYVGDAAIANEINRENVLLTVQIVVKERPDDAAQMLTVYWTGALLVLYVKLRLHVFAIRRPAIRDVPRKRRLCAAPVDGGRHRVS